MKQFPKNIKFKKNHLISSNFFFESQKSKILRGNYALKSKKSGKLTIKQIEACRRSLRRNLKKTGNIWLRVFTYASITKKSIGSRMGSGKGAHSQWVCPIRKGQIICEIAANSVYSSLKALSRAKTKLPFKSTITKIIY